MIKVEFKKNGIVKFSDGVALIKSPFFPTIRAKKSYFKNEFLLGLGGNIGDSAKRFERFLMKLRKDRRFFVCESSVILQNKAFGYISQDDFLNAILLVQSSKFPNEILKIMQHYEGIFGRKRSFKNAPRTLDLDILYCNVKAKNKRLILPHPGVNNRISVILPLGLMKG